MPFRIEFSTEALPGHYDLSNWRQHGEDLFAERLDRLLWRLRPNQPIVAALNDDPASLDPMLAFQLIVDALPRLRAAEAHVTIHATEELVEDLQKMLPAGLRTIPAFQIGFIQLEVLCRNNEPGKHDAAILWLTRDGQPVGSFARDIFRQAGPKLRAALTPKLRRIEGNPDGVVIPCGPYDYRGCGCLLAAVMGEGSMAGVDRAIRNGITECMVNDDRRLLVPMPPPAMRGDQLTQFAHMLWQAVGEHPASRIAGSPASVVVLADRPEQEEPLVSAWSRMMDGN